MFITRSIIIHVRHEADPGPFTIMPTVFEIFRVLCTSVQIAFAETRAKRQVESQNFVLPFNGSIRKGLCSGISCFVCPHIFEVQRWPSELGPLLTRRLPTFVSRLNEKSGSCENIAMFFRPKPEVSWVEASIFFLSATEPVSYTHLTLPTKRIV